MNIIIFVATILLAQYAAAQEYMPDQASVHARAEKFVDKILNPNAAAAARVPSPHKPLIHAKMVSKLEAHYSKQDSIKYWRTFNENNQLPTSQEEITSAENSTATARRSTLSIDKQQYADNLHSSWNFYRAQRSGQVSSTSYPIPWIKSSFLGDKIPGGWNDAGDTLKLNFPLSGTVSYLAWGLLEFKDAYVAAGRLTSSRRILKVALDYLQACHTDATSYVGQIGDPQYDHDYWGRAFQYPLKQYPRPDFTWTASSKQADLLGSTAAALAAGSLVYASVDGQYSAQLLNSAIALWEWGSKSEGLYHVGRSYASSIYPSSNWEDDMVWGAVWLYKATKDIKYLNAAATYWKRGDPDVYTCWDSKFAPAATVLISLQEKGVVNVPGIDMYQQFMKDEFLKAWLKADGYWSIVSTPKGMVYPGWSKWGNLAYSTNAAMVMVAHAKYNPDATEKAAELKFAATQMSYALGSTGRSFVVGVGSNYPLQPHHAGASCPDMPASCDWAQFKVNAPNPQILTGALVGGPEGKLRNSADPDDSYVDRRNEYNCNEPALDYNAGFTTVLAGLLQLL